MKDKKNPLRLDNVRKTAAACAQKLVKEKLGNRFDSMSEKTDLATFTVDSARELLETAFQRGVAYVKRSQTAGHKF